MRDDRGDQESGSAGAKRPAAGEGSLQAWIIFR
jgi:hypothetical protein